MLFIAALCLTGTFRLASKVANLQVAIASTIALALYPVFFAQSSMAHLDMAAAAFTIWALCYYFEDRAGLTTLMFSVAVLCKETAIVAPLALGVWELGWRAFGRNARSEFAPGRRPLLRTMALALSPVLVAMAWYSFHYVKTGYIFGNPEFFSYNVGSTLHPLRIALAFVKRLWQLVGYMNLFVLTFAALAAMLLPAQPLSERTLRPRISLRVQAGMATVIAAYVITLSLLGGAVLARYMLPVVPLVIILCVSTLWRRVRHWAIAVAVTSAAFVAGLFINPPYAFALEDNLAYRDYVLLHKGAANFVDKRFAQARVLTGWPATDELSRPFLGYTKSAIPVVSIENFSATHLLAAARDTSLYDVVLIFSTKYEASHDLLAALPGFEKLQERFFGFHRDLPPDVAAQLLSGRIVYRDARRGQWVAVIELERPENAVLESPVFAKMDGNQ